MVSLNYRSQQLFSGTGPVYVTFSTQAVRDTFKIVSQISQVAPFSPVSEHIESDALAAMLNNGLCHLVDLCIR